MGVYIPSMKMPDTCEECQVSCEVGSDLYCQVTDEGNKWGWKKSENGFEARPDWCPLRPLPEKHGRLGDLDEIKNKLAKDKREAFTKHDVWLMLSRYGAETIVEADGV